MQRNTGAPRGSDLKPCDHNILAHGARTLGTGGHRPIGPATAVEGSKTEFSTAEGKP